MITMDCSGAPAILLPEAWILDWSGFFVAHVGNGDSMPDLELPNGEELDAETTFDFENPITDYDYLCAAFGRRDHIIFETEGRKLWSVSDGSDLVGWWQEQWTVVLGAYSPPDVDLNTLEWGDQLEVTLPHGRSWLANACLHGYELLDGSAGDQALEVLLPGGRYIVRSAAHDSINLYRFQLLEPLGGSR